MPLFPIFAQKNEKFKVCSWNCNIKNVSDVPFDVCRATIAAVRCVGFAGAAPMPSAPPHLGMPRAFMYSL